MTKRSILSGGLMVATTFLLLLVLLLSNLEAVAFDIRHYREQFILLDRPAATKMTEEELVWVTGEIWAYLQGRREDLGLTAVIDGQRVPVFDRREQDHMLDVRDLFQKGYLLRNGGLILLLILVITAVLLDKKRDWGESIALIFTRAGVGGLIALGGLGLLLYFSFGSYFDKFHLLFFSNDFWRLDPNRHNLIKMFPQDFFFHTTVKFMGRCMVQLAILVAASGWYLYRKRGKGSR